MSVTGPSPVSNNPFVQQLSQKMGDYGSDGRITKDEAKDLKDWISKSGLPAEDQEQMLEMVDSLQKATNNSFFGLFSWKSDVSLSEMRGLRELAEKNNLAAELLESFSDAAKTFPAQDRSSFTSRLSSFFSPDEVRFKPGQQAEYVPENAPGAPGIDYSVPPDGVAPSGQRDPNSPVRSQFYNPDGTRSATGRADCGPTSTLMMLNGRGYNPNVSKYTDMRQILPADRHGAAAVSRDDIAAMASHFSGGKVRRAAADKPFEQGQSRQLVEYARQELAKGNSVIMLTGSFGGGAGHYTEIKGVNPDGTLQVKDGGSGKERTITVDQLEFTMNNRQDAGRGPAYLMSFTG